MKETNVGDKTIRVRATPLALLYYKQEFGSDLLGDFTKMRSIEKNFSKSDIVFLLKMIWAMAKADAYGTFFPGFEGWLISLKLPNPVELPDPTFLLVAVEEATAGFCVDEVSSKKKKNGRHIERMDVELLAIGKRSGLTFAEINEFRLQDLLDYVNAYTGAENDKPRKATKEDIDAFFAH